MTTSDSFTTERKKHEFYTSYPPSGLLVALLCLTSAYGTQPTTEISATMEAIASKRASLVSNFDTVYKTNVAHKVSAELLDALVSTSKSSYPVDIFISDKVDDPAYTKHDAYLNAHMTYTFNPDTNETAYTLNGQKASQKDIGGYMFEQELLFKEKRELNAKQRSKNIDKIAKLLNKEKILEKASKKSQEYLSLTLSKEELITVMQNDDGMVNDYDVHRELSYSNTQGEWDATRTGYLQGVSLNQMHDIWNSSFPNTKGEGVGIYYSDARCPDRKDILFYGYTPTTGSYTRVGDTSVGTQNENGAYHTKIITGILGTVANSVNLFCNDQTNLQQSDVNLFELSLPNNNNANMSQVHLETYSQNEPSITSSQVYKALDATFDQHSFNNRNIPIFVSTGNNASYVRSPAKAFNVISVGSYGRAGEGIQNKSYFSNHEDPITPIGSKAIRKPEVSAPGEHFHCTDPNNCSNNETFGTSFATPWTAALAADAMSRGSYWQNSAAMIKALVIAGASDPVSGGRDKVGEGGVDLFTMTWFNTNSAAWYDANPSGPFTPIRGVDDNSTCFTDWQVWLHSGREQRIVIAWLNNVTSATGLSNVPNSYSLELLDASGSVVVSASEDTQGYQIINTSQPTSGLYTVRVCKVRQDASQRFDMGFAVSQRVADAGWLQ